MKYVRIVFETEVDTTSDEPKELALSDLLFDIESWLDDHPIIDDLETTKNPYKGIVTYHES